MSLHLPLSLALFAALAGPSLALAQPMPACAGGHAMGSAPVETDALPPLFDTLGNWHRDIATLVPDAQRYFDQGLRLVYAFNHGEAIRDFEAAAKLDPACGICYWGAALANGPNINFGMETAAGKAAWEALQQALAHRDGATPRDRALIEALAQRYRPEVPESRADLDLAWANAMREVVQRFPDDLDAATLFAESLLDLNPWGQWDRFGQAKDPTILEAIQVLESVLKRAPEHPGANHYYIHSVEASAHPERALGSAERLPGLMPGAGHLVHMPSHVYIRTGRYPEAAEANHRAIAADQAFFTRASKDSAYASDLAPHNLDFLRAVAVFQGDSATALEAARKSAAEIPPEMLAALPGAMSDMEVVTAAPLYMEVAFGRWQEILAEPGPPAAWPFTRASWHFARGIALAAGGKHREAARELKALEKIAAAVPADHTTGWFYTTRELLAVARFELEGELAARAGRFDEAIAAFTEAVDLQDALQYNEPPPWYRAIRTALGKALLDAGRPADAEAVYREDLRVNPENGWSLFGLAQALRAQGQEAEAAATRARFEKAWARADVLLSASAF